MQFLQGFTRQSYTYATCRITKDFWNQVIQFINGIFEHLISLNITEIIFGTFLHESSLVSFLARLFYKTEEVLSPPARRRRRLRLRQRPVKFWGKLLRQKIMSSFISSLAQNLFIFAVLIHMVVLINNQALINIQIYYFFHFFHIFGNVSTLKIFV